MKTCISCLKEQPFDFFYDGKNQCKDCKKFVSWKGHIRRKFGITPEDFHSMSEAQNDVCAICGKAEGEDNRRTKLTIDHNHDTGKIRGLLCHNCNTAIGLFKDDISNISNAIDYLRKHEQ